MWIKADDFDFKKNIIVRLKKMNDVEYILPYNYSPKYEVSYVKKTELPKPHFFTTSEMPEPSCEIYKAYIKGDIIHSFILYKESKNGK